MKLLTAQIDTPESKSLTRAILVELVLPIVLLVLGIYHGLLQVLYRAGIIKSTSFFGLEYYQGLTLHGVVNAVVLTTFFGVAFGHAIIFTYLKQIPNLKAVWSSLILMVVGTLMAALMILNGSSSVLFTFYPPLKASPWFYIGATLLVVGSWIGFFSWIPCYLNWRKQNQKTPLAVLGIFSAFIVWLLATIPLAIEVIGMLIPWSFGWIPEIDVMVARTLFWAFGHPLVYFWLIPAYTMLYAMLPELTRGKLYSDLAGRMIFFLFIVFSAPVGLHPQFSDPGIAVTWKWVHAFLTFGVALPSFVTAFTLAASMEIGARSQGGQGLFHWWKKLPYFETNRWLFSYLFCGMILFLFGGITGIINASATMNNVVHNTSWMPGHFHTTVGGLVFLAFIGMTLHLVSSLTGKEISWPKLNLAVPYLWTIGVFIFSFALSANGLDSEPRRTNLGTTYLNPQSPLYQSSWLVGAWITALGGVIMTFSMVCYFLVFFKTLFSKKTLSQQYAFPESQAYHDESVTWVLNLKPWVVTASILLILAYIPPFLNLKQGGSFKSAPPYSPNSPTPIQNSSR